MTKIQTEIDLAPKRKYKLSANEKVRLKAMTDDGFPAMLIGKALGRSYKSVTLMQDAQSIHFKRNTKWSEKDMRILVAEKHKGTLHNDIGIMLNRSILAINMKLNKMKAVVPQLFNEKDKAKQIKVTATISKSAPITLEPIVFAPPPEKPTDKMPWLLAALAIAAIAVAAIVGAD